MMSTKKNFELEDTISNLISLNYDVADHVVNELLENDREDLIEKILVGCRIDRHGRLHVSKPLVVSTYKQHKVDYAIWRLIMGRKKSNSFNSHLNIENIRRIWFRFHIETEWDRITVKVPRYFKIPPEIVRLKNLRFLNLSGLRLEEIPEEVSALPSLRVLDISDNPLISQPILRLKIEGLTMLKLSNCGLSDIPFDFDSIRGLKVLDLKGNNFEKLPKKLWELHNLRWLNISGNPLNVLDIPKDVWPYLHTFISGTYDGYGRYEVWSLAKSVRRLQMAGVASPLMPKAIRSMDELETLVFIDSTINSIPEWLSELKQLKHLDISNNQSLRYIHSSIALMPRLQRILYGGLRQLLPNHMPELHGVGIQGFRNLLQDHHIVHEQQPNEDKPSSGQYGWISLWKSRLYRPEQKVDAFKRWMELQAENWDHGIQLNFQSTAEVVMEAVEKLLSTGNYVQIRTLYSSLRVKDGLLYSMSADVNPWEVNDSVINQTAMKVLAMMPKDEVDRWLGVDKIKETTLEIPTAGKLPEWLTLENKVYNQWRKRGCLPIRVEKGLFNIHVGRDNAWTLPDTLLTDSVNTLKIQGATTPDNEIIIDGWSGLQSISLLEARCKQIIIRNCPGLKNILIETDKSTKIVTVENCPDLLTLSVEGKKIKGLSCHNIPRVRKLALDGISGFNAAALFRECISLKELILNNCGLCELPDEITLLKGLEILSVFDRDLEVFPGIVSSLIKLRSIMIHMRKRSEFNLTEAPFLKGGYYQLPSDLYKLKYLQKYDVDTLYRMIKKAMALPGYEETKSEN
jgi:Leucine-rich repeat (LRR) protein